MKNILVTGGCGFIGANFVHSAAEIDELNLVVLDLLTYAGNRETIDCLIDEGKVAFYQGDICDETFVSGIMDNCEIDTIVHFAAESHVDRSISGPEQFIKTNVHGTFTLLECARKAWGHSYTGKKFHHVSTDEVYGSLKLLDPAFKESNQYAPNSPYAASKAGSDHIVRAYHHTYGMPVTTSNCSNNYGPYQFPEKLLPLCILNILEGKPLPIYGKGDQIRDWLHVDDHNRGIMAILQEGQNGEVYNIGGNNERTNIETVKILCSIMDNIFNEVTELRKIYPDCPASTGALCETLITFVKDRAGHDVRYSIDASKIRECLDFNPQISFEQGLKQTVDWYLSNAQWWQSIKDGSYRTSGK